MKNGRGLCVGNGAGVGDGYRKTLKLARGARVTFFSSLRKLKSLARAAWGLQSANTSHDVARMRSKILSVLNVNQPQHPLVVNERFMHPV